MGKKQEVEVKYPLNNVSSVIKKLAELQALKRVSDQYQLDVYYTPPHRDFLDNKIVSEWLRLRSTEKKKTINYKRWLPIGAEIQTHCDEYETVVGEIDTITNILVALDFKEIIRVEKKRSSWVYKNVEISIDQVSELGDFIELEYMEEVADNEINAIHNLFNSIISELNAEVGDQDRRGYPYLLIELQKEA